MHIFSIELSFIENIYNYVIIKMCVCACMRVCVQLRTTLLLADIY